jgi:hypothetical protein
VGLTENYVCSILHLHTMLFGDEPVRDMQIAAYRVGDHARADSVRAVLAGLRFQNPYDEAVYLRARERMWECDV